TIVDSNRNWSAGFGPLPPGSYGFAAEARDQAGNVSATSTITVSVTRAGQSIDFVSPVSSIVIGQPIRLSATSSAGLPIVFSIVSGNAMVNGDTLTITGPGAVVVRASQSGSDTVLPASTDVIITGAVRAAQT